MVLRLHHVLRIDTARRRRLLFAALLAAFVGGLAAIVLGSRVVGVVGIFVLAMPIAVVVKLILEQSVEQNRLRGQVARLEENLSERIDVDEKSQRRLALRTDGLETQLAEAQRQILVDRRANGEARERLFRALNRDVHALKKESGGTKVQALESVAEIERVENRLERVKQSLGARIDGADQVADDRHRATARRIDRERWARHRAFAARDSSGEWPPRVLLQMTINRTGSTRLFDMLRSNDAVYIEPLDFIWTALGMSGRRYPVGLSDTPGADTSIVSQDSIGVGIRSMRPAITGMPDTARGVVALEKGHPQFFDFDVERFCKSLTAVSREHAVEIDIVYQIRRPLDVMWSMAEYKLRDPSWHGKLTIDGIPEMVKREFVAIARLLDLRPGPVIDYDQIVSGSPTLVDLARFVLQTDDRGALDGWVENALHATSKSAMAMTDFVGRRDLREPQGPDGVWESHRDVLDACEEIYRTLRSQ